MATSIILYLSIDFIDCFNFCFLELNQLHNLTLFCSHMANIKTCFEQHTRGCSNLQFMMGKATLDFYQRTKYPLCTAITPTVPAYAGDVTDFNRIYQCVDKYVKGSPVAMMSDMPFTNGCDAFWEFLTCMGTGVTADEAAWAGIFAGQAFNTTVEFMMRFCALPIMDEADVADPGNNHVVTVTSLIYSSFKENYFF